MHAYRIASGRRIAPFGDEVREIHIGPRTLAAWQDAGCAACGLDVLEVTSVEEARERPCFLFSDDVFFSEMALRQFVADVMKDPADACLAVPDSATLRAWRVLDDERPLEEGAQTFDVFFLGADAPDVPRTLDDLRGRCAPRVQAARERTALLRLPPAMQDEGMSDERTGEAPLSARLVAHIRHWVHVLRVSQLSVGVTLLDALRKKPALIFRLRWMRGRDPWAIARRVNFVDPTARVHPTADLECAVIGPGTVVRAHAHVHRSVLGRNVQVGDHAAIVGCTLADEVEVLRSSYVALSASMPRSTLSSYKVQLSLFGREVFLTTSAWLADAKLRGDVRVEHEGRLVSVGTRFLGACLGHRVMLGAQVGVQPGRAVPNDSVIVPPKGASLGIMRSYPRGTLLTVRDGEAVPLEP